MNYREVYLKTRWYREQGEVGTIGVNFCLKVKAEQVAKRDSEALKLEVQELLCLLRILYLFHGLR